MLEKWLIKYIGKEYVPILMTLMGILGILTILILVFILLI